MMLNQGLGPSTGPVLSCVATDCALACGSLSDLTPTGLIAGVLTIHIGLLCHSPQQRSSFGNGCHSATGDKSVPLILTFKLPPKLTQPNQQAFPEYPLLHYPSRCVCYMGSSLSEECSFFFLLPPPLLIYLFIYFLRNTYIGAFCVPGPALSCLHISPYGLLQKPCT